MSRLAIFGASGHGQVVAEIAEELGWTVSFFDDGLTRGSSAGSWSVTGTFNDFDDCSSLFEGIFVAIGDNGVRLEKCHTLLNYHVPFVTLIHPRAVISGSANLGEGSVVMPGVVIGYGAEIGRYSILNTGSTIDHHCALGDGVHVAPGANLAGDITVGKGCWIGVGASVRERITLGSNVIVGAGAAVVKNVAEGQTVVGCPAEILKK